MALDSAKQEQQKPEEPCERKNELVEKYRKVGPAAINAALLCKNKPKKKDEPARLYEAHEEA